LSNTREHFPWDLEWKCLFLLLMLQFSQLDKVRIWFLKYFKRKCQ
jgi:hypothetical protein